MKFNHGNLPSNFKRKSKMKLCHCGEPAEVVWKVNGVDGRGQPPHLLCGSCMSMSWNKITENYKHSNALEASTFEEVRQ